MVGAGVVRGLAWLLDPFTGKIKGGDGIRLEIKVKDKFYYDIGLRKGNNILSKVHDRGGKMTCRFLEDFIDKVGAEQIRILAYGDCRMDVEYIQGLLRVEVDD